jgi:hypothetical protein
MGNRLSSSSVLSVTLLPERAAPEVENEQQSEDGQISLW